MRFNRETENLIASLRGLPSIGRRAYDRPTTGIGSLLEVIEETYQLGHPSVEETISQHWHEIVGEYAAHRCAPQRLMDSGSRLLVFAANTVIRQELMFDKTQLLERLRRVPNCSAIREIVIRCG